MQQTEIVSVDDLAAMVPDGCDLAIIKDDTGAPTELARALIRRGAKDLRLLTVPTGGYPADILIGAGCVARVETSGISLGEFGGAPRFMNAVRHAKIAIRDATCPAVIPDSGRSKVARNHRGIPPAVAMSFTFTVTT